MSNINTELESAMWAYIAGERKECPCPMNIDHYIRVLGALGGALDPNKVEPYSSVERYMLIFAKKLAAMREELEYLRAKNM